MNDHQPQYTPLNTPLPVHIFVKRLSRNILFGALIIFVSLGLGMTGYHHLEDMTWVEAYENAAMILSGMGPVKELSTDAGKIFAGTYALFSGTVFLVVIAIVFSPLIHRFFRHFRIEDTKQK